MTNSKNTKLKDEYYNNIHGFLRGLEATGYISHEESNKLQEELIEEYNMTTILFD